MESFLLSKSFFTFPEFDGMRRALTTIILIIAFVLVEWQGRDQEHAIANLGMNWKRPLRWVFYLILIFVIFWFQGDKQEFIYFQF